MKVLLGVGGGIAAYKAAELARLLMQQDHQVQVVMTRAAEQFVRPLTFAALTGRKVLTDLFAIEDAIEHIAVAQEHEILVIAPATADLMANLAALVKRGHTIVEPDSGYLACGMVGPGRLADPEAIVAAVESQAPRNQDL